MRILVAKVIDKAETGNSFVREPLKLGSLCCDKFGCVCARSWIGAMSGQRFFLAQVVETPDCFEMPESVNSSDLLLAQRAAEKHPVGTILRLNFDRTARCWQVDVA